jgi:hypothetical protein
MATGSKGQQGIDPAIIAYDLGLHEVTVQASSQRWACANAKPSRKDDRDD